jgi:hypothetical protein
MKKQKARTMKDFPEWVENLRNYLGKRNMGVFKEFENMLFCTFFILNLP